MFQDHKLLYDRSVFDNVALPLVIAGACRREIEKRVRAALDQVGLLGREAHPPITLSTGEQQRVGIARAVAPRPDVLIADEPTGNLDPELSREIMELFTRFNEVGVTLLIATHDLELIERMPHRRLRLVAGQLASGHVRRALSASRMRRYFDLHLQNLLGACGRLARQPFATLLTVLVIAIALALPAGLRVLVNNAGALERRVAKRGRLHRLLQDRRPTDGRARARATHRSSARDVASVAVHRPRLGARGVSRALRIRGGARGARRQPATGRRRRAARRAASRATSRRLAAAIDALPETDLVQLDTQWVARLRAMLALAGRIVDLATGLLALAVAIVVGNTIRLEINNRSAEIEVTKLVGGTDAFIRRPFLYLGFCYGLAGAVLAELLVARGRSRCSDRRSASSRRSMAASSRCAGLSLRETGGTAGRRGACSAGRRGPRDRPAFEGRGAALSHARRGFQGRRRGNGSGR